MGPSAQAREVPPALTIQERGGEGQSVVTRAKARMHIRVPQSSPCLTTGGSPGRKESKSPLK